MLLKGLISYVKDPILRTSVTEAVITLRTVTIIQPGKCPSTSSWWPIKAERPETVQALAMAKPPPRRRTNDHGIFLWITCQFKRAGEGSDEVTAK
jgi:hypothetical protein